MPLEQPTREQLLAQVAELQLALSRASPFVREVSGGAPSSQPNLKTSQAARPAQRISIDTTPDEILARIKSLQELIASGVNSAGYGDKRTEFRSLSDLRQILNDMQTQFSGGKPVRQIRMTSPADKGL